jgi:hypothetical protein
MRRAFGPGAYHPPMSILHLRESNGKAAKPLNLHMTCMMPGRDHVTKPSALTSACVGSSVSVKLPCEL